MCEAKSEGLVSYPTSLAPVSGSVTVTTQCVDNAQTTDSSTLKVTCDSHGNWSGVVPNCYCTEGYHEVTGLRLVYRARPSLSVRVSSARA